jgi:HSP20 family protein
MTTAVHWMHPAGGALAAPHSMDRLFEQLFAHGAVGQENGTPTYALPVDILETEDAYQLYATAGGVPQDSVEVTFEDGTLSIAVKAVPLEVQGRIIRQERPWGNWRRKLELPKEVDSTTITAELENGVLTVRVPKTATAEPMRIAVRTAEKSPEPQGS